MKRIAILTAGGDTPALNATIHGAVVQANERRVEVLGLVRGFGALFDERVPHIRLNPLFTEIPELDPTRGGTILGASRQYVDANDKQVLKRACERLGKLNVDGLICVGGDGTMNGLQPICEFVPTVLAPKTIDNDLGLNYPTEPSKWERIPDDSEDGFCYRVSESAKAFEHSEFQRDQMVNYVTPGYATAVFVSAGGVTRLRTTAESHRRIAIIEVMGRHSGFLALGSAYGQPDIILVPEAPLDLDRLVARVEEIYRRQGNVVIVCGEGLLDHDCQPLGACKKSTDPAGNLLLSGAAEHLRQMLIERIDESLFKGRGPNTSERAIFTRKVGHTQRGGRPLRFDRFHAAQLGGKAVDMLLAGENNSVSTLSWTEADGFHLTSFAGNRLRDQWGVIHARELHPSFYDAEKMQITSNGIKYLLPIFHDAIGNDDMEHTRRTLFDSGNLHYKYHSVVTDIEKLIQYC
jgi:6-phosphofructokinase 1